MVMDIISHGREGENSDLIKKKWKNVLRKKNNFCSSRNRHRLSNLNGLVKDISLLASNLYIWFVCVCMCVYLRFFFFPTEPSFDN